MLILVEELVEGNELDRGMTVSWLLLGARGLRLKVGEGDRILLSH